MIFLYIILSVIAVLVGGTYSVLEVSARRQTGLSHFTVRNLSWPAQQILKEYHKTPRGNRPAVDMVGVLRALDTKNGGEEAVDKSFSRRTYDGRTFGWYNASHSTRTEYEEMYNGLTSINKALAEQKHQLVLAGLAGQLGYASELAEQMREEARTIRTITKEIVA